MCMAHQTRQWATYSLPLRTVAEHIVSPWIVLMPDRCWGPHLSTGPDGSYSLLALDGGERVAKVFIMEGGDPLSRGGYVGLRSHPATGGIGARSTAERRLWDLAFQAEPNCVPFFALMNPAAQSIGLIPQQEVCFAYFVIPDPQRSHF